MINTIIIDDEPYCVEVLETLLAENFHSVNIVGSFTDATQAIGEINDGLQASLMFIDINMPRYNGFELLDRIMPFAGKVVFTTAYDQYAIKAFKYGALDYLLKPIAYEDLEVVMKKIINHNDQGIENGELKKRKIIISNHDGVIFQKIDEILYCEADNSYTTLFLTNGKKIVISKTLKEFEHQLSGYDFYRIHNSYLINLNFVEVYSKSDGGSVVIRDQRIPISRTKKDSFMQLMQHFIK